MIRILAAALLLTAPAASAAELSLAPGSVLWLEGKSTLHPYSSTATRVVVEMTLESAAGQSLLAAAKAAAPARLSLRVPVAGLKSAHGGLDKNMRKALKAGDCPDIVFSMGGYKAAAGRLAASGSLTVACSTRPVALDLVMGGRGAVLVVEGEQALLMTDFGIKPPRMMLGAIKTEDRVLVKFHLELKEKP